MSTPYYYGPEDIYNLAAENGVVPAQVQADPTQEPVDSRTARLAGTDVLGGSESLTPPTAPDLLASPQGPSGVTGTRDETKTSSGWGAGVSVSGKRLNPDIERGMDKYDRELARREAASKGEVDSDYAPVLEAQNKGDEEMRQAQVAKTQAEIGGIGQEAKDANYLKGVSDKTITDIQKIQADHAADINQAKSRYMKSLAEWSAMKVDPGQFWDRLSGAKKFQFVTTAFMHGFLDARGIKTSAMDSLNQGIENNIKAQIHNIQHGKDVTEGFRQLYENEVKDAHSQIELVERMRPYYLESAKQQVIANMAPYKSALASANGMEAIAKIDQEKAKSLAAVQEHITANKTARMQQDIHYVTEKAKTAAENYSTSVRARGQELEQKRFDLQQRKQDEKDRKEAMGNLVIDPEDNTVKWTFREGRQNQEKEAVNKAVVAGAEVNRQMTKLQNLARKIGGGSLTTDVAGAGSRVNDEDVRQYDAIRKQLAHAMVAAVGERANDKDIEQFLQSIPIQSALTKGGIDRILTWTQQTGLNHVQELLNQHTYALPKDQWQKIGTNQYMPKGQAETDATLDEAERGGYQKTQFDTGLEHLSDPKSASTPGEDDYKSAKLDKKELKDEFSYWARNVAPNKVGNEWKKDSRDKQTTTVTDDVKEPTKYVLGIAELSESARGGDKKAMDQLVKLATESPYTGDSEDKITHDMDIHDRLIMHYWAQYELTKFPAGSKAYSKAKGPTPVGTPFEADTPDIPDKARRQLGLK